MHCTNERVTKYVEKWKKRGYRFGIPDSVPCELVNYAPSYQAIAKALLKNDLQLTGLGYTPKYSEWYSVYKKIELSERRAANELRP